MSRGSQPSIKAAVFRFVRNDYDPASGEAQLVYALDDGPELVETLHFPNAPRPVNPDRQRAFERALDFLHLVAGVSYYKTAVPPAMDAKVDASLSAFLERLYVEGLAEFAYNNGLELAGRVNFSASGSLAPPPPALNLPDRALVAMGGGKDSLVSLEWLRDSGLELQPVCVGQSTLIESTVQAAGMDLLRIGRRLAPELKEMNEAGALNGHVPVTAINSAILLCAAVLYGYRHVVFSNERSADEATLTDARGRSVNHQYSKSLAFESALREQVRQRVASDIEYFSLLRPLYEVAVAQRFSRLHQYHDRFSSCNRNFHLDGARVAGRWCGDCPKCRFTAVALAPWLSPDQLVYIMGRNVLDEPGQEAGFRALCGLGANKPFECIGTVDESRALLQRLAGNESRWRSAAMVRLLARELEGQQVTPLDILLDRRGPHCIPAEILSRADL